MIEKCFQIPSILFLLLFIHSNFIIKIDCVLKEGGKEKANSKNALLSLIEEEKKEEKKEKNFEIINKCMDLLNNKEKLETFSKALVKLNEMEMKDLFLNEENEKSFKFKVVKLNKPIMMDLFVNETIKFLDMYLKDPTTLKQSYDLFNAYINSEKQILSDLKKYVDIEKFVQINFIKINLGILYEGNLDSLAYARNLCSDIESNFSKQKMDLAIEICTKVNSFFNGFATRMTFLIPKEELNKHLENYSKLAMKELVNELHQKGELISKKEIFKESGLSEKANNLKL